MAKRSTQRSYFVLEEILQLLHESLQFDPFNQSNYQPTKKHIARFRNLLGQEFSFWLAETGNLFFSVLITAKPHADNIFTAQNEESLAAMQLYRHLLHVSQLIMSVGIQSEQTIAVLLKLNALLLDQDHLTEDLYYLIETTILELQKQVLNRISIK